MTAGRALAAAAAVVGHVDVERVAVDAERDERVRCVGVAQHVGERLLHDAEAGLLDRDRDGVVVQLHVCGGVDAGGLRAVEQLRQRCEVEGRRRRGRLVGGAQQAQRRAQVVQRFSRHLPDVFQRTVGIVASVEVRGDAGADVDCNERVRDRVVQLARDPQSLVGDPPQALLFALLRDPQVAFAARFAELAPRAHRVADDERAERDTDPDRRVAGEVVVRRSA